MVTFKELLEEFFFVSNLKTRSINSYKGPVRLFSAFLNLQGIHLPEEVTQRHALMWRQEALTRIRAVSWNNYSRHLRSIYNFGIDHGVLSITKNPFEKTSVREPKKPKKTLSKPQISNGRKIISEIIEYEKRSGKHGPITPGWFWQIVNETFY
ncbi:hypothetical protein ACCD10_25380 [Pseudomonas sp. Pseusp122]|uniref:hypothetical protein n=1 Tax=unclassified Pseudomonas TaxID=196821 RepID=UPI0039A63F7C